MWRVDGGTSGAGAAHAGAREPHLGQAGTDLPSDSDLASGGTQSPLWQGGLGCSLLRRWFRPLPALPFGLELGSTYPACPGTGKSGLAHAELPRAGAGELSR